MVNETERVDLQHLDCKNHFVFDLEEKAETDTFFGLNLV